MLFDTHAHYDDEAFDADRDALLTALPDCGVGLVIDPGCDLTSSRRAVELAAAYPHVYAAVGIHPENCGGCTDDDLAALRPLAQQPKVVAIGEIGLDYYYDLSPREIQKTVFERQLDLAYELKKPVILHIRDAHGDTIEILRAHRDRLPHCVVHCCSASWESAKIYLSLDCMISFAGPVTFKKSVNLQEVAKNVPLDRLMIETDSPYLAPVPYRGKTNEPAFVAKTAEKIAAIKGLTIEETARITTDNFFKLYRKAKR